MSAAPLVSPPVHRSPIQPATAHWAPSLPAAAWERTSLWLTAIGVAGLMVLCSTQASAAPALDSTWAKSKSPRQAAQLGIDYLSKVTPQWQEQHKCFGCHVQAVTMHALAVAKDNQYTVKSDVVRTVLAGLTTVNGGSRGTHGLSHSGGRENREAKSYGGSALAFYDQYVYQDAQQDLVDTAKALVKLQAKDGSVTPEVARFPVSPGPVHTTYMAIQTFRQAYARTADDQWRAPLRKSERWLKKIALSYTDGNKPASIQDLNFAILGLLEAGTKPTAKSIGLLKAQLVKRQNSDGGFAFHEKGASNAYATGQSVFALRRMGLNDSDRAVSGGTKWLVKHQRPTGEWTGGGRGKAEALWAVLGLVAIDVAQIDVAGLQDGARMETKTKVTATATAEKAKVKSVSVVIDDVEVHKTRGSKLNYTIDPKKLSSGIHLVDVVAELDGDGAQQARRRLEIYTGDTFLIDSGSRFNEDSTVLTVRNLGADAVGKVRLDVVLDDKVVSSTVVPAENGPMQIKWKGDRTDKKKSVGKTFVARFTYVDAKGKDRQAVDHLFTHDTLKAQREAFTQVSGRLAIDANDAVANTQVDLLDESGNVVQSVTTTRSGQYRFKNVKKNAKVRVRVRKQGFDDWSSEDIDVGNEGEAAQPSATLQRK